MPSDPGLAADTCIFMEAIPGDGGNQNASDVWWLSPDITQIGHPSGLEFADPGANNLIKIGFHRKPAGSGCQFPGDESITVQAWVANPSLVMSPSVRGSAARVGFIGSPVPAEGGRHIQEIAWSTTTGLSPTLFDNPREPGPKCLVAICYPDSLAPSETKFFVPGDQHVAQHNLCIFPALAQSVKIEVNTFNPSPAQQLTPSKVKLRAVMDLAPSTFVQRMVLKRVNSIPGFQQLRTAGLPLGFAFDLTGLQATQIVDLSQVTGPIHPPQPIPSFEAMVELGPGLKKLNFIANLKAVKSGEACIFHLTQTFKDLPQGGLTLVVLKK